MAVTQLRPGGSKRCPPGTFLLDWQVVGRPPGAVDVRVEQLGRPGVPAVAVQPAGPGRLMVLALPVAVRVVARPAGGAPVFAEDTLLEAQLHLTIDGQDGGHYVLPTWDVSSTSELVLCSIDPAGTSWAISVPGPDGHPRSGSPGSGSPGSGSPGSGSPGSGSPGSGSPGPRPPGPGSSGSLSSGSPASGSRALDVPPGPVPAGPPGTSGHAAPVSELALRARNAARRIAAGADRLPPAHQRELHLAVDGSASMLPLLRAGALQALTEVVVGVNEVAGTAAAVPVWPLRTPPRPAGTPLSAANVDGYVETHLGAARLTSGARVAPVARHVLGGHPGRTLLVVTDSVPPDLDALVEVLTGQADAGGRLHLLVLAAGRDDATVRMEPWRDELRRLEPAGAAGLSASTVTPGRGSGWLQGRLSDPGELDALVAAIAVWPTAGASR